MADSAISGLDPTPQNLNDSDITIISQNVNGVWVSVKMTLTQLKTFVRFGLDIPSIFGLTEAIASKAELVHGHTIADITGLATALNSKAPTVHTHGMGDITGLSTALDGKANTVHSHTMADITGLATALSNKFDADKLGVPNGAAPLGPDGLIPNNLLPAVFRWIILENDYSDFPQTGTEGVLYIDKTSNITYRWNGSAYIPLAGDVTQVTLGDGIDQAYPGNKGKVAYDHSQSDHAPVDAQKNSDITQQEIEEKLIGDVESHGHSIEKINGLSAALNGKAPTQHTHEMSEIDGLSDALDAKLDASEKDAPEGIPSLDEDGLLRLTQFPDLNFILTPKNIVVEKIIQSAGGVTVPSERNDIVSHGTIFSGDLSSPSRALDFNYEWIGNNSANFSFVQGDTIQFKFTETADLLTDTSDALILTLEFEDVNLGNGQTGRQAKVTVSNSTINEQGTRMTGDDGNQLDLRIDRTSGILSVTLENFPILSVDVGVVHNFVHFIEDGNTLKAMSYQVSNSSETIYNVPFDLEDGVLYRVSIECIINSRKLYSGDCFILYQNKARILIFRSSLKQQQLEELIDNHTHFINQIDGLQQTLDALGNALTQKSNIGHTHTVADVSGLQTLLNNINTALNGKAPTVHTHAISAITDLQGLLDSLRTDVDNKAASGHTHAISQITGLENQLNSKSPVGHDHPEITANNIMLVGFEVASMPVRVTDGDSTQLAIEKLQRQVDLLSGFAQNVFEPSEDFPFVQADGVLYLFSSGTVTDTQSAQDITLAPGYYRIIAGAAAELEPGVVDTDGKWTRVFKASNSSEVYVSQETSGENILAVGEYQSTGNPGFGNFGGVGYASNVVFPYLFKHIEELHRGVNGSGGVKGTRSGAISVSQPIIVATPLDVTLLIGANIIGATDTQAGFVWIRELSHGSVTVPNQFELTNGIYDGTTLGWDGVGTIEVSPDTFSGYRALRPNFQNDVVTYTIPDLETPTDDVTYNLGLQSEDGVIKFIEIVYTSAAGGSLTVKENGVDLFGELFATLPLNIQIRKLGDMIFEIIINDDGPTVVNRKIIFTDGEVENKFYLEGLFVEEVDVKPSLVQVESIRDPDGQWFNSGTVVDFVNKVLYWDRVHQLNIGSSGSPIMVPQYSSSRSISTGAFVEFNTETFDENDVKSIDFYLATTFDVESAKVQNKGHVSLNNVDNAGTIVTTLTNFVTGEIELIDADALVIDKIKFTRTSDTEVLVEYYEDATAVSNIFTIEEGAIFIIVEVKTSTGVEIINLPFDFGNV